MKSVSTLMAMADLPPAGNYVLAVSGGVDSVVLLDLLATADRPDWRLHVAHYDHGVRADSAKDAKLVRQLAAVYGLPFHTGRGNLGQATEERARQARYEFLRQIQQACDADAVITAHHLDDRRETSIHNVLRGAGRVGSAPLKSVDGLYRPLIKVGKADLIEYAKHRGLPWREDSTNNNVAISRNFIRRELLPTARDELSGFEQSYDSAVSGLSKLNQKIDQQLQLLLETRAEIGPNYIALPRALIAELRPPALQHLLAFVLRRLKPDIQLSQATLSDLARLTKTAPAGQQKSLAKGLKAEFSYDKVTITFGDGPAPFTPLAQALAVNGSLRFGRYQISAGNLGHGPSSVAIKPMKLLVRAPLAGDRLQPVGLGGSKKLQDIFVDTKLPRAERLHYPVVSGYNNEVVWVPGLALSEAHQANPHDPQALILTYEVLEV